MEKMEYDFRKRDQEVDGTSRVITIAGGVNGEIESFKHLG